MKIKGTSENKESEELSLLHEKMRNSFLSGVYWQKENAISAFDGFFNYLNESGNYKTDEDNKGHYMSVFLKLLNKNGKNKIELMEQGNPITLRVTKIVNNSKHKLPSYQTLLSAGMDLRANIESDMVLKPLQRSLIPTGLYIQLPEGYEAQIRPRSGLAFQHGITVLNTPGTIDADYRGEIKVLLINLSEDDFVIKDGERICQMVVAKHEVVGWMPVDDLDDTSRGSGGFGHTGK